MSSSGSAATPAQALRRWFKSTSNRTFIVWPIALFALQCAWAGGWPAVSLWGLPLLAWGYLQYRWVGSLRAEQGGGGPGLSNPPLRLVTGGPYRWTRNPMYLGHLLFFAGLAVALSGAAWLVFAFHAVWFDRRVRGDEAGLLALFGEPYRAYHARVRRWIPGIY